MKRSLLLWMGLCFLAGCNFPSRAPAGEPTRLGPTPRPLSGAELAIDQLMLHSAERWNSLFAEADLISYPPEGGPATPTVDHVRVWIEQPARFRLIVQPGMGGAQRLTVSDGRQVRSDNGEIGALPPDIATPFAPPPGPADSITLHPLGSALGLPVVGDLLFPVGLAQRSGTYRVSGQDTIAGRAAQIIDWSYVTGQVNDRLWIDRQTGVALRQVNFGKSAADRPLSEVRFTYIEYELAIPPETFALDQPTPPPVGTRPLNPGDGPFVTVLKNDSGIVNLRGGPGTSFPVAAQLLAGQTAKATGKSPDGEWWQVAYNGQTLWVYAPLVELSGDPASVPVAP